MRRSDLCTRPAVDDEANVDELRSGVVNVVAKRSGCVASHADRTT